MQRRHFHNNLGPNDNTLIMTPGLDHNRATHGHCTNLIQLQPWAKLIAMNVMYSEISPGQMVNPSVLHVIYNTIVIVAMLLQKCLVIIVVALSLCKCCRYGES